EDVAFDRVAEMIVEDGPALAALRALVSDLNRRRAACPRLAVNQKVRVNRAQLAGDQLQGLVINQPHEVEAEAVHFVFGHPVAQAVHDVAANHRRFGAELVAGARSIPITAVLLQPVVIARNQSLKTENAPARYVLEGVVEHNVERDAYAAPVQ